MMNIRFSPGHLLAVTLLISCSDPSTSAEADAGFFDAGSETDAPDTDAVPLQVPERPLLIGPMNGANTGSALLAASASVVNHPLRPRFTWQVTNRATSYEIQFDDSCPVENYGSCTFPSPITATTDGEAAPSGSGLLFRPTEQLPVSMSQPVGQRYTWRLRGCNEAGCGPWSRLRYLNVGRHESDFNGDGFADLAVGAHSTQVGTVPDGAHLYYGSASGFPALPDVSLSNPQAPEIDAFGSRVASAGDLNSDGYADLVVGAQEQDNNAENDGAVYVYYGQASGISQTPSLTLNNPDNQGDGYFGSAVAGAGDLNGDGYADLAVGAEQQDDAQNTFPLDEGAAFVYYGSAVGISSAPNVSLESPFDQANAFFGNSLSCAGDLDGDGFADLVVGSHNQAGPYQSAGNAYVYYGSPTGISTSFGTDLDSPSVHNFGSSLRHVGDVNGDGYGDLLIGAEQNASGNQENGSAYLYYGRSSGIVSTQRVHLDNPSDEVGARFGSSVSGGGDLNGDGFADIVVGAPGQDSGGINTGSVFFYYGASGGAPTTPSVTLDNPTNEVGANWGQSVASRGDINGDGFADLVIGVPNQNNGSDNEGSVIIYHGAASGVPAAPSLILDNPTSDSDGSFGFWVAN